MKSNARIVTSFNIFFHLYFHCQFDLRRYNRPHCVWLRNMFSVLTRSALKWPLDCSGKIVSLVLFVFLYLPSFSSHPVLLVFVESSEVKHNSIRWLLPWGLWCSFSSCFSLSLHPTSPPPYAMLRSRSCIIVIVTHAYWIVMHSGMHLNIKLAYVACGFGCCFYI